MLAPAEEDDPATTEVDEGDALRNVRVKDFLYSEIQNAEEVDIGARIRGIVVITWIDDTVEDGVEYRYRLRAMDRIGNRNPGWSDELVVPP